MFALLLALALAGSEFDHDHSPQLGKVSFDTSCSIVARPLLQRGLGWLHSFEYEEAANDFTNAAAADPRCGIAHWGVAMSYYHPLWVPPTPAELEEGSAASVEARKVGAGTPREQGLIDAIGTFYHHSDRLDHRTRAGAYETSMEELHRRYPEDHEIAIFYALALIAAGMADDDSSFAKERQAGAILNMVLAKEPNHPGVAHYIIHSFDNPQLAESALPAARRYADIAPASAHAQHMPSHIFIRLGMWDEAIKSNLGAEAAARAYAKSHGLADSWDERLHAMDYLAYAYLQTGRDKDAQRILDELYAIQRVDPPNFKVAYSASAIPARIVLERRKWDEASRLTLGSKALAIVDWKKFPWGQAHIAFARAVGAARSGNPAAARIEISKLRSIEDSMTTAPGEYDWRKQVSIERQIAEAWLYQSDGQIDEAIRLMRAAADLDDATEKHPVTPGPIFPAREQLGELLLEVAQPVDALKEYQESLKRAPRRLAGLYGAARSARAAGDGAAAKRYFAELAELAQDGDQSRAEVKEAKAYIAKFAAR